MVLALSFRQNGSRPVSNELDEHDIIDLVNQFFLKIQFTNIYQFLSIGCGFLDIL